MFITARDIWAAGNGLCCCCGQPVVRQGVARIGRSGATIDHVFPRNPLASDMGRIASMLSVMPPDFDRLHRSKAVAHHVCNTRKGNRPPTGCEVIFLMAVNARLAVVLNPHQNSDEARRAKIRAQRQRKRANRRAREMQAEHDAIEPNP